MVNRLRIFSVVFTFAIVTVIGCGTDDTEISETHLVPTRFHRGITGGSSSSFDISFRPIEGAVDYVVTVYKSETSMMPLESERWSGRSTSPWGACVPRGERQYCIRMREGLYEPFWFTIAAIFPDREITGNRFCFHYEALSGRASGCPKSETQDWVIVDRGEHWVLEKHDTTDNMECRYRDSCQPIELDSDGTPITDCMKICEP